MSDDDQPTTSDEPTDAADTSTEAAATPAPAPAPGKGKRWQRITSVVLLVIGFILVPLSAVALGATVAPAIQPS